MQRPSASSLVILLVVLVSATISVRSVWMSADGNGWKSIVRSDVKGYYGYLQALFVRHDLGHEPDQWEFVRHMPTGTLNKYFCGTSIMMAPWFAAGRQLALLDPDAPRDGLSSYELKAIGVGAWAYLLLGLLAMRALLLGMGARDAVVAWTIIAIGLGTQLLQFTTFQPGWSHIYSFAAISVFLQVVHRLGRGAPLRWAIVAAALLGLIVLIRPVNALVVLAAPIVPGSGSMPLLNRLFKERTALALAVIVGALVVALQPMLWHAQTGNWFAYGYTGEGFHWNRPEVFKVLFGFRRGLFLWAPVLLLFLAGTLRWLRTDRHRGVAMMLYFAINVYVISSWWIWYYGSGFGARVFIDHYPVMAIPIALLLNDLTARWWVLARVYIAGCVAFLGFQMFQYNVQILHHESMDRAKYLHTFLRWGDEYRGRLGGNYRTAPYNPNGMDTVLEESCDLERHCPHWSGGGIVRSDRAFSGGNVVAFTDSLEFGLAFATASNELPSGRALYLEVGLQRYESVSGESQDMLGVTDVVHADGTHGYYELFNMNPVPGRAGTWEQIEYRIAVPGLGPGDRVLFYFWNKDRDASVLIDDVFMRISAVRPY